MRGINKVILIGTLGQNPDQRSLPNGNAVANISLATNEAWKDKQTGQRQERTEWHRVVFFNRLAEIVGEFLQKGSKVYIEGTLRTRKWQDSDSNDRYTTEIIATDMQMLGDLPQASGDRPRQDSESPAQPQASAREYRDAKAGAVPPLPPQAPDEFDDDIPF